MNQHETREFGVEAFEVAYQTWSPAFVYTPPFRCDTESAAVTQIVGHVDLRYLVVSSVRHPTFIMTLLLATIVALTILVTLVQASPHGLHGRHGHHREIIARSNATQKRSSCDLGTWQCAGQELQRT
jgi:hypothetical protein